MTKKGTKADKVFQELTDRLIEAIENNPGDWSKPWRNAIGGGIPANATTGNQYHGGNVWTLAFGRADAGGPQWATYKQWNDVGCQVRKGQHGVQLVKWFRPKCKAKHPKEVRCGKCPKGLFPTAFTVFHAAQCEIALDPGSREIVTDDGEVIPAVPPVQGPRESATKYVERRWGTEDDRPEHELLDHAEAFIAATGADILHAPNRAFYSPLGDYVSVPEANDFESLERYYGTVLHELTHWTGHRNRCARPGIVDFDHFGSETYAKEELVAELGSVLVGEGILGIEMPVREDHAAYLASWLKVLKADPRALHKALTQASKAAEHLASYSEAKVEREPVAA